MIDTIAKDDKDDNIPPTQPLPKSKFANQGSDLPTYLKPSDFNNL